MTQSTGNSRTYTKTLALTGTGVLALALLTGCSVADEGTPDGGASATASGSTAETSPATADDATDDATDSTGPGTGTASASGGSTPADGEDPVFAAIEAFLADQPDAIIVEIDQDDDDTRFDVEAVVGEQILDFDVMMDGEVREDDDDDDDDDQDDIRRAQEAELTAEDAARAALEGRDGSTIDSVSLDDDDNTLRWDVELDNRDGDDDVDLHVDAATGEVTQDD